MTQRERLIELLKNEPISLNQIVEKRADYLIANGVVVLPCRCCECKHYFKERCVHPKTVGAFAINRNKDDFCSYGERKGGDE